jgi:integrase
VEEAIDQYQAQLPKKQRKAVEGFVKDMVRDLNPDNAARAQRFLTYLTRYTLWCAQHGYSLDRDVVLRMELIVDYCAFALPQDKTKTVATTRSHLRRASVNLLTGPHKQVDIPPMSAQPSQPPYSERELTAIRAWALHQTTHYTRVNATVLLALTLGAGLSTKEVLGVRASHITTDAHGVLVDVTEGKHPRTVPVLAEWEEPLTAIADASIRRDQYVFMPRRQTAYHRSQISNFVRTTSSVPFPISASRLRTTWVINHLAAGTPAKVLATAAGYTSPTALGPYLTHVPNLAPELARQILRRPRRLT